MNKTNMHALSAVSGWKLHKWLPDALTTRICLWMLETARPPVLDFAFEPRELALAQMEQGENIIRRIRGDHPGDEQAMEAYRAGVAVAYFGLKNSIPDSSIPEPGSAWKQEQLQRLRKIGLKHGEFPRHLLLAGTDDAT